MTNKKLKLVIGFLILIILALSGCQLFDPLQAQGVSNFDQLELEGLSEPALKIGDASEGDDAIVFDGNAQDFYVALDDSADDLLIGLGSVVGTTPIISMDENQDVVFAQRLIINGVQGADSAATNETLEIAFTSPVDTTGINTHNAFTCDLSIGNSTGGTNNVVCLQIDAITGDAHVVETAIKIGDEWDYAIDTNLPIVSSAMYWFDDFLGDAIKTEYVFSTGSDATAGALEQAQFGVITFIGGATDSGFSDDHAGMDMGLHWSADQGSLMFEVRLNMDTDITGSYVAFGLTDTLTEEEFATIDNSDVITTTAVDGVAFVFDDTASTKQWFAIGVDTNTDATGNGATGTAPSADTYQVFRIEVDAGGAVCRFYIDGSLVATLTANCVTPSVLLTMFVLIDDDGANSQAIDVDYVLIAADRD